ncbi:MAG: beta-propeller domain-containing protein [Oscillospiraceae bacterium]|jgi:uncharacterized secreted protein with C-terminal beta-propeller domain|nr:beta-propeller domain-containing protein [Oscillospiraceae bacterium]
MNRKDIHTAQRLRREFRAALHDTQIPTRISPKETDNTVQWEQFTQPRKYKIHWKKPMISAVAAVLVFCVALGAALYSTGLTLKTPAPPDWVESSAEDKLAVHPQSEAELEALFRWFKDSGNGTVWDALRKQYGGVFDGIFSNKSSGNYNYFENSSPPNAESNEVAIDTSPRSNPTGGDSAQQNVQNQAVGQTNNQIADIDEQDIIKNSGKTLFIASPGHVSGEDDKQTVTVGVRRVQLLPGGKMKEISPIIVYQGWRYVNECEEVVGMFLHKGKLIVISQTQGYFLQGQVFEYNNQKIRTIVRVYSDADGENPQLLYTSGQDGTHLSSRLYNGRITVTTTSAVQIWSQGFTPSRDMYPQILKNGKEENLTLDKIYSTVNSPTPSYLVVANLDLNAKELNAEHCAVLGAGENLYCSGDTLYVGRTTYDNKSQTETEIYKFALDGKPRLICSGSVPGRTLNQFSMDEYQGNLRIATQLDPVYAPSKETTHTTPDGSKYEEYQEGKMLRDQANAVFVLDSKLKTIGQVNNVAPGEQIQSVRFVGATGYVVTFLQTDPLFVLDLANANKPKVVGELKIPGFSSYLHPVGDGWLLGVGVPGNEKGATGGIKLSLFDVRDPKKPKEVNSIIFENYTTAVAGKKSTEVTKNYSTDAQWDHKAFFSYPEEGLFGLPIYRTSTEYTIYDGHITKSEQEFLLYTFRVKDGKLVKALNYSAYLESGPGNGEYDYGNWYTNNTNYAAERATYVDNTIYTRQYGKLFSFDLKTAKRLGTIDLDKTTLPDAPQPKIAPPVIDPPNAFPEEGETAVPEEKPSQAYNPG